MRYWISPQDKSIPCSEHGLYVLDHPKTFGIQRSDVISAIEEYGDGDDWLDSSGIFDNIIDSGWIRVYGQGRELSFSTRKRDNTTLDRIMLFMINHKDELGSYKEVTITTLEPLYTHHVFGTVSELISGEESIYESKSSDGEWKFLRIQTDWQRRCEVFTDAEGNYKYVCNNLIEYTNPKGKYHRIGGPARIDTGKGTEEWFLNGVRHRIGGPAWINHRSGHKSYYVNGKEVNWQEYELHFEIKDESKLSEGWKPKGPGRVDFEGETGEWLGQGRDFLDRDYDRYALPGGWVCIYTQDQGYACYNKNGDRHRMDGPALNIVGTTPEFFVNGKRFSKEEFEKHFDIKNENKFKKLIKEATVVSKERQWDKWFGFYVKTTFSDGNSKLVFDSGMVRYCDSDNKLHRIDGPATTKKGYEGWYLHGKKHRVGGPAEIIHAKNNTEYYWYQNGKFHNTEGPAIIHSDGKLGPAYIVNGKELSEEEFYKHFGND